MIEKKLPDEIRFEWIQAIAESPTDFKIAGKMENYD